MATMRVAQVSRANGPFELVERPIPEPGPGTVRIKVEACGICHSDSLTKEGQFGVQFPRVSEFGNRVPADRVNRKVKHGIAVEHVSRFRFSALIRAHHSE